MILNRKRRLNFVLRYVIIHGTSAPWQYARSYILSVCRPPGAFLCLAFGKVAV